MLLRSWWPYSRLAMAFCWLQDDASISKVLALAEQNLPLYKDDSRYWLNLGIGRVCLFQVENTWKSEMGKLLFSFVASGIAGESSGSPKLRYKEHANSRKWWRSWFLDIEWCLWLNDECYVCLSCSWDHSEVQKDPIKDTNLGSYYNGLNPRERPWTLKSVNLKRSNLPVDSICCFSDH